MSNNKQSSIDWLVDNLKAAIPQVVEYKVLISLAKAMHKEEIMKAAYDNMGNNFDPNMGRAEQYYNETYKQD